jgi:hypothetical protein
MGLRKIVLSPNTTSLQTTFEEYVNKINIYFRGSEII